MYLVIISLYNSKYIYYSIVIIKIILERIKQMITELTTEKLKEMMADDSNSPSLKNKIMDELFFRINGWKLSEFNLSVNYFLNK
tara:strand:- start:3475 stop:3726 length:252 start_codon:yes stop_codon:yes gene_type:complete